MSADPSAMQVLPAWARHLQPADAAILGLDGPAADVLAGMVQDDTVDLAGVTGCLDMLKAHAVVLHFGAPPAMLAYSPGQARYSASFDGEQAPDLDQLTEPQAGLWLAALASEHGELPHHTDQWGVIRVDGHRLQGRDQAAISLYLHGLGATGEAGESYDQRLSRAFWHLAGRCQAGR